MLAWVVHLSMHPSMGVMLAWVVHLPIHPGIEVMLVWVVHLPIHPSIGVMLAWLVYLPIHPSIEVMLAWVVQLPIHPSIEVMLAWVVYLPIHPSIGVMLAWVVHLKFVLGPHSSYWFGRMICWYPALHLTEHLSVWTRFSATHTKPPLDGLSKVGHVFLATRQQQYQLNDWIRNTTEVFNPRQNSVWEKICWKKNFAEKKLSEKKLSQMLSRISSVQSELLVQINAYHHWAVHTYCNQTRRVSQKISVGVGFQGCNPA